MRTFLIAFGIIMAVSFFTLFGYYIGQYNQRKVSNDYTPVRLYNTSIRMDGKVIDLPEELPVANPTDNLGVEITHDTIYIYFKTIINYPK